LSSGVFVATLTVLPGYTGTMTTANYQVKVSSYFSQADGTITAGTSTFVIGGDVIFTGGNFSGATSTISYSANCLTRRLLQGPAVLGHLDMNGCSTVDLIGDL